RQPAGRAKVADRQGKLRQAGSSDPPSEEGHGGPEAYKNRKYSNDPEAVIEREQASLRRENSQTRQQEPTAHDQRQDGAAWHHALRRHLVAKKNTWPYLLGAPERPERKQQRHEQAITAARQQAPRADGEANLDGQGIPERRRQRDRDQEAERDANHDADCSDQQHLQEMDAQDGSAGRAEALEGGDHPAPS